MKLWFSEYPYLIVTYLPTYLPTYINNFVSLYFCLCVNPKLHAHCSLHNDSTLYYGKFKLVLGGG
jgi:hypothetical protein